MCERFALGQSPVILYFQHDDEPSGSINTVSFSMKLTKLNSCDIWCFHGGEDSRRGVLGCDTV